MTHPRAAVLGHPIGHSLSPALHRAAYQGLGIDWRYDAIDVTVEQLPGFVGRLGSEWRGLSLTMPLKHAVLPLLDVTDPVAAKVGAANTVVFAEGQRLGFNTDVLGISQALSEGPYDPGGSVTLLGAGATAASALAALAGADKKPSAVLVAARRPEASANAAALGESFGLTIVPIPWAERGAALRSATVISTLPGNAAADLADSVPTNPGVFLDLTYSPWPTTLAAAMSDAGARVIGGFRVLLWQAAAQVQLMTGQSAPVTQMADAGQRALADSQT